MITKYLARNCHEASYHQSEPNSKLGGVIVIPSFAEEKLEETLNSLTYCYPPKSPLEVIVVINHSQTADDQKKNINERSLSLIKTFEKRSCPNLNFLHLKLLDRNEKNWGVGLARKVGMDLALKRLWKVRRPEAPIICLDGDCTVSDNYFLEIERVFINQASIEGASIAFEHPLDAQNIDGIVYYESHLRYHINSLRWAGFRNAHQTIGSAMAVRASSYARVGGMNRRQAGEDFYFLNKVINLGSVAEINSARVYPSPRISDRVPFGTGKAMQSFKNDPSKISTSYNWKCYEALSTLFKKVLESRDLSGMDNINEVMKAYLKSINFEDEIERMKSGTNSESVFWEKLARWFDAFKILKFLHFARDFDSDFSNQTIEDCLLNLYTAKNWKKPNETALRAWLQDLRSRDYSS